MDSSLFVPRSCDAAVFNIAFACATGLVLLGAFCSKERLRQAFPACWGTITAALILQLWLTVATMTASTELSVLRAASVDVLIRTHAGLMVLCSTVIAVVGFLSSLVSHGRKWQTCWATAVLVTLAALRSASGHAAVDGPLSTAEFSQFIHLSSTSVWSGCIIISGIVISAKTEAPSVIVLLVRRVSHVATISVVLVLLTGIYKAYRSVDMSLTLLEHSTWGAFLIPKISLVAVAIGLGAYSRSLVRSPIEVSAAKLGILSVALCLEAVVMVLILGLSAFLANSPAPL